MRTALGQKILAQGFELASLGLPVRRRREVRGASGHAQIVSVTIARSCRRRRSQQRPNPAISKHHRVVAPSIDGRAYRPYWSQRTRLVRLLEEGAIDRHAFAAGVKLRGWCETLFRGAKTQTWDVPIDHGGRLGAANDAELIGARRLQAVASNLERDWFAVLQMMVTHDRPWARICTALGLPPKTAKTHSITALQMLARWFRQESAPRDDSGPGSHRRRRD